MNLKQAHLALANNPVTAANDYELRIMIPIDKVYASITFTDNGSGGSITRDVEVVLTNPQSNQNQKVETVYPNYPNPPQDLVKGSGETKIRVIIKEIVNGKTKEVARHTMPYAHALDTALSNMSPALHLYDRPIQKDHEMQVIIPITQSYSVVGVTETSGGSGDREFELEVQTNSNPFNGDPLDHSFLISNLTDQDDVTLVVKEGPTELNKQKCQPVRLRDQKLDDITL
ncbi:MAG: hypothetical protein AAF399_19350 [Bacteroidota bacterium]